MENTQIILNTKIELGTIKSPIFLLFAEYLGYDSPVIEWAEDICNSKDSEKNLATKCKFVKIEAIKIFNEMKKEFTMEEIINYYKEFYPLVLRAYEDKLNSKTDDLPF